MAAELAPRPMVIEEFTPRVGQLFRLDCSPRSVDIILVSATPLSDHGGTMRLPFALLFQSDPQIVLEAGIYTMRSGPFGPDLVYLEQTIPPPGAPVGNYYQAVFN